jgi:alpha-tubulin suppressor-like RCC1 family protein
VVESEKAWPQQVAAAGDITCVRLTDGTVQCAGDNTWGALGKDPKTDPFSMFFKEVPSFTGHAVQVATAYRTVCALLQGGSVVCWGGNDNGELGQGTTDGDPHIIPASIRF